MVEGQTTSSDCRPQSATPRSSASVEDVDNDSSDDEFDLEDWESFVYQ